MHAALTLAAKDLRLLVRDRAAAFFTFVFPLAIALFFGFVFSGTTAEPMRVAVLAERESAGSRDLLRALAEDGSFVAVPVADRADGERLVRRASAAALVVIPADWDERVSGMLTGDGARLELVVDPSRRAESGLLTGKLHEAGFRAAFASLADAERLSAALDRVESAMRAADMPLTDRLALGTALSRVRAMAAAGSTGAGPGSADDAAPDGTPAGGNPLASWQPVQVAVTALAMRPGVPANSFAISFTQGIAWALFGAVLSFGSAIAEERQRGTMIRLLVSPMTIGQVLVGKAFGCFAACMLTQWVLLTCGVLFFGVAVSNWPMLVVVTAVTSFAFAGVMMLLAAGFRTEGGAQGAGRAILLVLAMVGGGTVPLVFMPAFLRMASNASPFTWALLATEGATWRSWSVAEFAMPLTVLAVIGGACMSTGVLAIRRAAP